MKILAAVDSLMKNKKCNNEIKRKLSAHEYSLYSHVRFLRIKGGIV